VETTARHGLAAQGGSPETVGEGSQKRWVFKWVADADRHGNLELVSCRMVDDSSIEVSAGSVRF
jgi:hypothetical protein